MIARVIPIAKLIFITLLLLPFLSREAAAQCSVKKPSQVKIVSITSCDATLSWSSSKNAAYYQVRYKQDNKPWVYISTGLDTTWNITGLLSNTSYSFSVASFCSSGLSKGFTQKIQKQTLSCTQPINASVSAIMQNQVTVSWQPLCNSSVFNIQCRQQGTLDWSSIKNISATTVNLLALTPGTTYEYQLQSKCGSVKSSWTAIQTFSTLPVPPSSKPNIFAVMLDDGRYDIYQPTGGPAWFNTPSITRIASEGVNFQITIPGTSQCAPSRATFYTGLYPHHNGCEVNGNHLNPNFPLIQQILKDNGYYTGFVGKYGQFLGNPKGFDYWAVSNTDAYIDVTYTINGVDTFIAGNISDIFPLMALDFLNQVPPGMPFALFYFPRAPHSPTIPTPEEALLYTNDTIPFPPNFYAYTHDYPNFYYYSNHKWPYDAQETDSIKLLEFQTVAGVEQNVDTLMDWLESHNILDSTLVMYTSDNGYMKGEHLLQGKDLALETSIRLPMFIRYPKWFSPANITDQIASNIDIAPTFLELAGIPDTFGMDGVSLHKLATHDIVRNDFLYEFAGMGTVPALRAVRSLQYKYIYNYCTSTTEEFYDLVNDPFENNNLINNSSYSALIETYRIKLDSLRTAYTDKKPKNSDCYMMNPTQKNSGAFDSNPGGLKITISPDPASGLFNIQYETRDLQEAVDVSVQNMVGDRILTRHVLVDQSAPITINCSSWPSGLYMVSLKTSTSTASEKIMVSH